MTAVANPVWIATDDGNRPVHDAKLRIKTSAGTLAETFLDPGLTRRGANPRVSNLAGKFCNSAADTAPQPVCLAPGDYVAEMFYANGAPLQAPIAFTVPEGKGGVIQVTGVLREPAQNTQTVVVHGGGAAGSSHADTHVVGGINGRAAPQAMPASAARPKAPARTSVISAEIADIVAEHERKKR
jgi:hypothetical protein